MKRGTLSRQQIIKALSIPCLFVCISILTMRLIYWYEFTGLMFRHTNLNVKVRSMQRSGTEAIKTQIQPSKPKREITNITNSQNTKRTYGQPSKRWPLSNQTKNNMNTHKVKHHRNSDTKNRQQRTTTKLPPWNGQ